MVLGLWIIKYHVDLYTVVMCVMCLGILTHPYTHTHLNISDSIHTPQSIPLYARAHTLTNMSLVSKYMVDLCNKPNPNIYLIVWSHFSYVINISSTGWQCFSGPSWLPLGLRIGMLISNQSPCPFNLIIMVSALLYRLWCIISLAF